VLELSEALEPESVELESELEELVLLDVPEAASLVEDDAFTSAATIATPRPPVRMLAAAIAAVSARAVRRPRSLVLMPRGSAAVLGDSYEPARCRPRTAARARLEA